MELYQIIATVNNTSTTFQLAYLPENFEGVKISHAFSFVNPMGYNPKFSVDTMRIILSDKAAIDTVFNTYGLQSDVTLLIKKLNTTGIGYSNLATFAIDFESYEIQPEFSEFALKSVSAMDYYNEIKNSEKVFELPFRSNVNNRRAYLPTTQNFINYISLKSTGFALGASNTKAVFKWEQNNEPKVYNLDAAITDTNKLNFYVIGSDIAKPVTVGIRAAIRLTAAGIFGTLNVGVERLIGVVVVEAYNVDSISVNNSTYYLEKEYLITIPAPLAVGSLLRFAVQIDSSTITDVTSTVFLDSKRDTNISIIGERQYIWFDRVSYLVKSFFNGNVSGDDLSYFNFTSANCIKGINREAVGKPSEIMRDLSIALGLILNFKLDGSASVQYFENYFSSLLNVWNAIAISDFQDLSIKYFNELNYKGVEAGQESNGYELYTYSQDWNKKLTFVQAGRKASEMLDLSLTKLRTDFSGILDYYYRRSQQDLKNEKDLFVYNFNSRTASTGEAIYDIITPRDILTSWNLFLSFCFQNFGLNTLTISSNGGTEDNLTIGGVAQMDNLTLNETPRLLPIQYDFTCLLDSVDFSEKILKINDNGTDVYLFVINAETTDNLSEQKISGLKIQF